MITIVIIYVWLQIPKLQFSKYSYSQSVGPLTVAPYCWLYIIGSYTPLPTIRTYGWLVIIDYNHYYRVIFCKKYFLKCLLFQKENQTSRRELIILKRFILLAFSSESPCQSLRKLGHFLTDWHRIKVRFLCSQEHFSKCNHSFYFWAKQTIQKFFRAFFTLYTNIKTNIFGLYRMVHGGVRGSKIKSFYDSVHQIPLVSKHLFCDIGWLNFHEQKLKLISRLKTFN